MAFILLVRDGDTTRLFTPAVFESRQAALAELPRAGAITGTEELFLVDLDAATPVIVVAQEAAAPAVPPVAEDLPAEESVGVWEAPAPVEAAPVEERRFSRVIPPGTTFLNFLRTYMSDIAPNVRIILQYDRLVLQKREDGDVVADDAPPPPPPIE